MKPYTLGIYEKAMPAELSWKEKMETAKAAGYDFIPGGVGGLGRGGRHDD